MPTLTWTNITTGATGHTAGARWCPNPPVHNKVAYVADGNEFFKYSYDTDAAVALGIPAYTGTPTLTGSASGSPKLTIPTGYSVYGKVTYHDSGVAQGGYGTPSALLELAGDGTAVKVVFGNLTASANARVDQCQCWMTVPKPTGQLVEAMDFFLVGEAADTTATQTIDLTEESISGSGREVLEIGGVGGGVTHGLPRIPRYLAAYDTSLFASGCVRDSAGNASLKPTHIYRLNLEDPDSWDDNESKTLPDENTGSIGLSDECLVFTVDETWALVGTGTRMNDYTLVRRSGEYGCVAPWSIKMMSDGAGGLFPMWLSRRGVIAYRGGAFDNVTIKNLTWFDPGSTKWNQNYIQYSQAGVDYGGQYYVLALPLAGSTIPNFEMAYNMKTGGWEPWSGRCGGAPQWSGRYENQDVGEVILIADNAGKVYYVTPGAWSDAGTAIDMKLRLRPHALGDPRYVKRLAGIRIDVDDANTSATSFTVQVYEDRSDTAKPTTPMTVTVADFSRSIGIMAAGNLLSAVVRENTLAKSIRVNSITMTAAMLPMERL